MNARALLVVVAAASLAACAFANGYDPSRYAAVKAPISDPETEPLPPSPKQRMRDPRGVPAFDAGAIAAPAPAVAHVAPVVVEEEAGTTVSVPCGTRADPCPMQRFMHGVMETAHTPDSLTTAFSLVAGLSPDPEWAWVAIATRGADLANAGEVARAKAQCVACHDSYRRAYQSRHRARPF